MTSVGAVRIAAHAVGAALVAEAVEEGVRHCRIEAIGIAIAGHVAFHPRRHQLLPPLRASRIDHADVRVIVERHQDGAPQCDSRKISTTDGGVARVDEHEHRCGCCIAHDLEPRALELFLEAPVGQGQRRYAQVDEVELAVRAKRGARRSIPGEDQGDTIEGGQRPALHRMVRGCGAGARQQEIVEAQSAKARVARERDTEAGNPFLSRRSRPCLRAACRSARLPLRSLRGRRRRSGATPARRGTTGPARSGGSAVSCDRRSRDRRPARRSRASGWNCGRVLPPRRDPRSCLRVRSRSVSAAPDP